MRIHQDLCNGCGKCVAECPKTAIGKNDAGGYAINAELCDECAEVFDIECIRRCDVNAITLDDGTVPGFDPTRRFRSEHLIWLMAVLGARGNGRFPVGVPEWDAFRRIISAVYLDPNLQVRLTRNFDDNCIGCPAKQTPGHPQVCGAVDDACFAQLGLEPGTVMRLWDAVKLAEEKFAVSFIRSLGTIHDYVLDNYLRFASSDARVPDEAQL